MANWGRPKIKVHIYDFDCKYIRTFDTIADFRRHYWPEDICNRPLFIKEELNCKYEVIREAGIIAMQDRPGREAIRLILAINDSEYCRKQDQNEDYRPVQILNLRGEIIAEFATHRLAVKLMPHLSQARLSHQLSKSKNNVKRNQVVQGGLIFKYKE